MSQVYFAKFSEELKQIKTVVNRIERLGLLEAKIAELLKYMGNVISTDLAKALLVQQASFKKELESAGNAKRQRRQSKGSLARKNRSRKSSGSGERSDEEGHRPAKKASSRVSRAANGRVYYRPIWRNNKAPLYHRC